MSCTENESGPFVVFFLPAVVGCLTILLARRWANSQVSNTSSTAVSRRRKIIKDPLIKRPLPSIAPKMHPPANNKRTTIAAKKVPILPEEDISGKRLNNRVPRFSPAPNPESAKIPEGPLPPKHIPFPNIPQDGELLFETMTFIFTSVAAGLQFLNLYRTVWWLPHSYTNHAMNFYLIDPHVVAFILTILARRFLVSVALALVHSLLAPKMWAYASVAARTFVFGVVIGAMAWCQYFIMLKHPLVNIFYLCYPAIIYFGLFGFRAGPFLELSNGDRPTLHGCTQNPAAIREEVDYLREDFNLRVKKILFGSIVGAYYSNFIPCTFAQSYLYYDVYSARQQIVLLWGGLVTRYAGQLLSSPYCDVLHRAALHLGSWQPEKQPLSTNGAVPWSEDQLWPAGSRVTVGGVLYTSVGSSTAARPDSSGHRRFYTVFKNPSMLLCLLLCSQLSLVLLQLCLLFSSSYWHHFLSLCFLLFMNYYTLFKSVRDYLVAWKVYKAEFIIQDKNNAPVT